MLDTFASPLITFYLPSLRPGVISNLISSSLLRFSGSSGTRRTASLVRGGVLGGEDPRGASLFRPGVVFGHFLRPTSRHGLLLGSAGLRQQEPAGANGPGQDRLRRPAQSRGRRRVGVQPQLLSHLHQVGHTGQPGLADAAGAQSVPRVLHKGLRLREGEKLAETQRPRVQSAAADGFHRADQFREGLGSMLHQTVHQ